jgi:hypothetical protein
MVDTALLYTWLTLVPFNGITKLSNPIISPCSRMPIGQEHINLRMRRYQLGQEPILR